MSAALDKVYKYTIDGTYVGRWNIDPANAKPTGITIDPTGASDDIWIVDNLTDSVYQYDGGATRTGGSALNDAVFTLDAANTNPQGIADPNVLAFDSSSGGRAKQSVAETGIINHHGREVSTDAALLNLDSLSLDSTADDRFSVADAFAAITGLNRTSVTGESERIDQAMSQVDDDDEKQDEDELDETLSRIVSLRLK